jgi:3-methyladenine DNA glycosylase AlkD
LDRVVHWGKQYGDIQAAALVGSYARGKARQDSDIDLVLLIDEPPRYLEDTTWVNVFGTPTRQRIEYYGRVTSLRVWYEDGLEVEFGLTTPGWASTPLDSGTRQVIMDGFIPLFERKPPLVGSSPFNQILSERQEAEQLYTSLSMAIREHADPQRAELNRRWFKNEDFQSYGLSAAQHTEVSRVYRQPIRQLSLFGLLYLARRLASSGFAEDINFANAALSLSARELGLGDFRYLDRHIDYFHGWAATDDFSINVLQPLLLKYPDQTFEQLKRWNQAESLWKRRASVVVFVRKVGESGLFTRQTLELCDNLVWDSQDLVQKGIGWALKDSLRGNKQQVLDFIKDLRRRGVPAAITLYAIRDLHGAERREILDICPNGAGRSQRV